MRKEFILNNVYYFNYSTSTIDFDLLIFDFFNYGFFFKLFWFSDFLVGFLVILVGLFGVLGKLYINIYKLNIYIYNFVVFFCFIFLLVLFNNIIILMQTIEFELYFFKFFFSKLETVNQLFQNIYSTCNIQRGSLFLYWYTLGGEALFYSSYHFKSFDFFTTQSFLIMSFQFYTQLYGVYVLNCFIKLFFIIFFVLVLMIVRVSLNDMFIVSFEILLFFLFSIMGMFFIITSDDLVFSYMALELQSLSFYVLASYNSKSKQSTEAGLKYFLVGSIASLFVLSGIIFLYFEFGSTNLTIINSLIAFNLNSLLSVFGFYFILIGLFIKLGVGPFHMWIADIYEGVLMSVMVFFAVVPKLVITVFIVRVLVVGVGLLYLNDFIFFVSLLSVILGSLSVLYQLNINRFVAYSAVSHMGFVCLGFVESNLTSMSLAIFYILIYSLLTLHFFSILLILRGGIFKLIVSQLSNLVGFFNTNLFLCTILVLNIFSLAGIPPLLGFFPKAYVLLHVYNIVNYFGLIIFIIMSVLSAYYYLRVIKLLIYDNLKNWLFYECISINLSLVLGFISLISFVLCFFFDDLLKVVIFVLKFLFF